jgi:hypothetical protein
VDEVSRKTFSFNLFLILVMIKTKNNLENILSMNKFKTGINTDRKVDYKLVQQLEDSIDSLRKLQNNISNNFRMFKLDFDDFLIESAGYFAKSITEVPQIGNSGIVQRIEEALLKIKPKGKISLSVSTSDHSLIKDFEPEFKSMIEPFQEFVLLCDEGIKPGDFKIESDNLDIKDIFESNLEKLIGILRLMNLSDSDISVYDFDNKENISKKIEELNFLSGFEILREIDSTIIANIINNENPQTIAVILSRLPQKKSIEIISRLSAETRSDTCEKIKDLNNISSDTLQEVENIIYRLFKNELYQKYLQKSGATYLSGLLADKNNFYSKMILNGLIKNYPDLASKLSACAGSFEDIVYVDDRGIQNLIKKVKRNDLAAALINSPAGVLNKFLCNMSSGAVEMLY